jgi:hypothetical protein
MVLPLLIAALVPQWAAAACARGSQWFAFDTPPPARPAGQELIRGRLVNSGPAFARATASQTSWIYPGAWLTLVGAIDAKVTGFGVVKALPVYAVVNACTPAVFGRRGAAFDKQVYLAGAVYRQGDRPVFVASSFQDRSGGKRLSLKTGSWIVDPWGPGVNPWAPLGRR